MKKEATNILDNIKDKVKEIEKEIIDIRRHIHSYPELGNEEYKTMEFISNYLNSHEIKHKTKIANTGIVADIEGEDKSFTIAFRADIDALPIEDLKHCSYASKNKGICHACGHDVHTAINMGIARIFSNKDKDMKIAVIFVLLFFIFGVLLLSLVLIRSVFLKSPIIILYKL